MIHIHEYIHEQQQTSGTRKVLSLAEHCRCTIVCVPWWWGEALFKKYNVINYAKGTGGLITGNAPFVFHGPTSGQCQTVWPMIESHTCSIIIGV